MTSSALNDGTISGSAKVFMRVAFLLLFSLATSKIGLGADRPTLKIAMEGLYPGWNSTDDQGALEGFEVDLADDLCRRIKANCEIIRQDWDGMIQALNAGRFDIMMARVKITEKRRELIDFSVCYAAEASVFAVKADNALAATITPAERINLSTFAAEAKTSLRALRQALAGTAIGVQIASTHADFVERYLGDLVEIRYYDTLENLTRELDSGTVDAALSTRAYWRRLAGSDQGLSLALVGPDMIGDVFGRGVGAGLRKEDGALRARLNKAIQDAAADGTITRLSRQWFGYDLSCS